MDPAVQRASTEESRSWDRRMDPAVQRGSIGFFAGWLPGITQLFTQDHYYLRHGSGVGLDFC